MAADIIISYGGDEKSRSSLRKEILKAVSNLDIDLSGRSITNAKKKVKESFEQSPPKISIDINASSLKSARSKILAGLSDIKIKTSIDIARIKSHKKQIESILGNISFGFKDQKMLGQFEKTMTNLSKIKFDIDQTSFRKFLTQAQSLLNQNPLTAKVVAPGLSSAQKASRSTRSSGSNRRSESPVSQRDIDAITTFGERVGFTTSRLIAYTIAAGALFRISQGIRSAASSITEIDTAINRLTQILDGNVARASKLAASSIQIAENFGQSGRKILGITDELAQAGGVFNSDQSILSAVNAIARTPLLATFNDIQETVNGTIAALNQFNLKAEDTVRIIDIANQVSKKFAFQSQDLFTAISRGGSSFRLAGGTVEEFTAFVAAAKELTLLPATTIGTGINTISLNLLKAENIDFLTSLTGGKIKNASGELKGVNEILIETGRALRGLNKQEVVGVLRQLFDVRQSKIGGPILLDIRDSGDGLSRLEQIQEETRRGVGSSARDAEIGLERIDTILGSIGARFDKVFKQLAEDNGIKTLVKDFASLAKSFADTVGALAPIIPSLVRVAASFGAFSLVTSLPGFIRGSRNVQPGPFNPASPSSTTSRSAGLSRALFGVAPSVINRSNRNAGTLIRRQNNESAFSRSLRFDNIINDRNSIRFNKLTGELSSVTKNISKLNRDVSRDQSFLSTQGITRQQFLASAQNAISQRSNASQQLSNLSVQRQGIISGLDNINKINRKLIDANKRAANDKNLEKNFRGPAFLSLIGANPRDVQRLAFARELRRVNENPANVNLNSAQRQRLAQTNFANTQKGSRFDLAVDELARQNRDKFIKQNEIRILANMRDYATLQSHLRSNIAVSDAYTNRIKLINATIDKLKAQLKTSIQTEAKINQTKQQIASLEKQRALIQDKISKTPGRIGFGSQVVNAFGRTAIAGGRRVVQGLSNNAEILSSLGVGIISDAFFQNQRNNLGRPSSLFDNNGQLRGSFSSIIDENNRLANRDNQLSNKQLGSQFGTFAGASIGSAFGPLGSLIGAGIGSVGGSIIGSLSSKNKDISNEVILKSFSQANNNDRKILLSEFLKRNKINAPFSIGQSPVSLSSSPLVVAGRLAARGAVIQDQTGIKNFRSAITSEDALDLRSEIFKNILSNKNLSLNQGQEFRSSLLGFIPGAVKPTDFETGIVNSLKSQGFSAEQAEQFLREYKSEIKDSFVAQQKIIKEYNDGLDNATKNLADFVNDFNKSTQNIKDALSVEAFNFDRIESIFRSGFGSNIGPTLIPNNFADILSRQLSKSIEGLGNNPNAVAASVNRTLGDFATTDEKNTIASFLSVRQLVSDNAIKIRSGISNISPDANESIKAISLEKVIGEFLNPATRRDLSKLPDGQLFLDEIRNNLKQLSSDPNITKKSEQEIVSAVLGRFADLDFVSSRLAASLDKLNQKENEKFILLDREITALSEIDRIRNSAIDANINNIPRLRAIGAGSSDIISILKSQLTNVNLDGTSSNFIRSFNNSLGAFDTVGDENNALIETNKANYEFKNSLNDSTRNLQILNSIFDELTSSIKETIDTNKRIGLSSVSERISGQQNLSIVEQRLSGLFGRGGLLEGVSSPEGLVAAFGDKLPDIVNRIGSSLSNDSLFINAANKSSLFGGTLLSGGTGQTVQQGLDIVGTINGLFRTNPRTGGKDELNNLLKLGNDQLKAFFDGRSIEQKQLDVLTSINNNIITAFKLPINTSPAPSVNLPSPRKVDPPASSVPFNDNRLREARNSTGDLLSFANNIKDRSPGAEDALDSLKEVLKEFSHDLNNAIKSKNESKIDFKSDINIQGFENIGKDKATALITISVLEKFMQQLLGGTASEQALANKLNSAIIQIRSGIKD